MSDKCILAENGLFIKLVEEQQPLKKSAQKALANCYKIVYAFLRYPISVSRTVLVQGVPSHAGRGKEQLVTFARIWTRRITNISLRRSLVEFR